MHDAREAKLFLAALLAGLTAVGCAKDNAPPSNPGPGPTADGSVSGDPDTGGSQPPPADADVDFDRIKDAAPPKEVAIDPVNTTACEGLRAGPFAPVMPASMFNMAAPPIASDRQVYRVTLPARDHGFVTFNAPALGEYVFFLSTPAPMILFDVPGNVVPEKNLKTSIPECMEVKGRVAYRLVAGTHVVRIGPHPILTVDVMVASLGP
jgi:hypothetical protein